jgi:2-polyprenyl-6-methoxyphenol hydroxylase-like FAD-dependent oxidoreductase
MTSRTAVLVVGGSLNGLTTALLLAHHGVDCIVVERHPNTTVQYKFRGISPRSMEIYRGLGIQDEIRAHLTGDQKAGDIGHAKNLSDPNVQWMGEPWADTAQLSAATAETCDQDHLEPILRAHAERLGADIRFNTELVAFEQDTLAVRCRVRHRETGTEELITAAYLVAADGVSGKTREWLHIGRHGPGELQHWMNLIFDTDLQPYVQGRRFTSCFVSDVNGSIVPREDRWLLAVQYSPERGERPEDFDQARTEQLVRQAAGRADTAVRLFDARHWDVIATVADRFREGRAFLVGDAAHAIPPTGGFGGNTGIHDAHNLAWKLAFVLRHGADTTLLDSYDAERRHAAERTQAQALARLASWFKDPTRRLPPVESIVDDFAVIFGQLYPNGAVVSEGNVGDDEFEDPRHPSGRPGSRAAHFVLNTNGRRVAIHDLFDEECVLLTSSDGSDWADAAATLRAHGSLPLSHVPVGGDDNGQGAAELTLKYGVNPDGAVLVRPDGVIAWRARTATSDNYTELRRALTHVGLRVA